MNRENLLKEADRLKSSLPALRAAVKSAVDQKDATLRRLDEIEKQLASLPKTGFAVHLTGNIWLVFEDQTYTLIKSSHSTGLKAGYYSAGRFACGNYTWFDNIEDALAFAKK